MGTVTQPTDVMWDLVDAYEEEFPSAVFSGINGDVAHQENPGKHLSRSQNKDKFGSDCWPLRAPNDQKGPTDKAIAVDISMSRADQNRCHNNFIKVYNNRKNDPRAKYIYAFNGWNGSGSPWRYNLYTGDNGATDESHKWHEHEEGYYAFVNDPEFVRATRSAFRGESIADYTGGDDMNSTQEATLNEILRLAKNTDRYGWQGLTQLSDPVSGILGGNNQPSNIPNLFARKLLEIDAVVDQLAARSGLSDADLAEIKEAARQGATEGAADTEAIVAGVLAGIEDSDMSAEQRSAFVEGVEKGVRAAFAQGLATPPV